MNFIDQKSKYSTDHILKIVWRSLAEDFAENVGSDVSKDLIFLADRGLYREFPKRGCYLTDPIWLKYRSQLENFFKRWTFESEAKKLSTARESACFEKFLKIQSTCAPTISLRSRMVLSVARRICRGILGVFDEDDHIALCKFSNNATTLSPRRRSDPDQKFIGPISGSPDHIAWFKELLKSDSRLSSIVSSGSLTAVQTLDYTTVPKKWDIDRGIMPNTTIGSYYTSGLGRMIRRRLKTFGLNLRYAPGLHQNLARQASINRKLVTADLSSASDSFWSHVVNAIVPRDWFNKLKFGRLKQFLYKGKIYGMSSFMTMGIGFTFELQTLLFYCILLAIQEIVGMEGKISVFGDDLIYPTEMHNYVRSILQDLGFTLNTDKTFVKENFRESCGGDFHFGFSVRPYQKEGTGTYTSLTTYQAFLYQTLNGLSEKYCREEIPRAVDAIEREIFLVSGTIYQVPLDYPDYSGVRTNCITSDLRHEPVVYNDPYTVRIRCLSTRRKLRVAGSQDPFYWNTLHEIFLRDYDSDLNPVNGIDFGGSPPKIKWKRRKNKYVAYVYERDGTFVVVSKNVPR